MRKNQFKYTVEKGQKFTRLTVLKQVDSVNRKRTYLCQCDCGNLKEVDICSLYYGNTQSCGCFGSERRGKATALRCTTHGESSEFGKTPEYRAWQKMKERCYWPDSNRYYRYGARGIMVCNRWKNSYECFLKDIGRKPSKEHSLDRINTNGNYDPENCRWSTRKIQMRNTSRNKFIKFNGLSKTIAEWCEIYKLSQRIVNDRIKRGWNLEKTFSTPPDPKYRNKNYVER